MKPFWQQLSPETAIKLIKFWPPYLGAGIKVESYSEDKTEIVVSMKLSFLNTNYVGVHFGGSLYSMCDPFFMLLLGFHLGKEYLVWDKSAEIDFLKPGKGKVTARFHIPLERVDQIRQQAQAGEKIFPTFETYILDEDLQQVACVKKVLYVRLRSK